MPETFVPFDFVELTGALMKRHMASGETPDACAKRLGLSDLPLIPAPNRDSAIAIVRPNCLPPEFQALPRVNPYTLQVISEVLHG